VRGVVKRRVPLVALAALAVAAALLLPAFLPRPAPTPPAPAPQQPVEVPVGVNATQPAERAERPQPPVIVAVVEAGGGGRVLMNGTEAGVVSSTRPFALVLEAVPDRGYVLDRWLVNGTDAGGELRLNLTVAGNTTITAVFRKVAFTARFLNVTVPVKVNVTGRVYTGDFAIGFNGSLAVEVAPYGADDAGCIPYNVTRKACLLGWLQDGKPLYVRYLRANLTGDATFVQLWKLVKANYSAALIDIWVGNTTIKTTAEPSKILLVPFDATYEAVNGWFHVKGDDWSFNIKMPPWRKLRVYVNYTAIIKHGAQMPAIIAVVVRNGPVYLDVGTYFGTTPLTVFTFDWGLVELYGSALERCNFQRKCMEEFALYERDYYNYVTCYNIAWSEACKPGKTMGGPGERMPPGVSPGDFYFFGSGEMWIRIEVAE
jgi:hypothetical protein